MQQTQVITVTQRLTSVALLYEMSSFAFVPMNLSRKLCLALIWLTENEKNNYSVFHLIWTQEWGYCELDLGLLRSQRASMWPQDWAEITFRSEILSNMFKNEAGRWLVKGQKSGSGDLSMIYEVSQNEFLLKSFTPKTLWLSILVCKVILVKELTTNQFCQD